MEGLPVSFRLADGRSCTVRLTTEDDAAAFCEFMPRVIGESDFLLLFPGEFQLTVAEERPWLRERIERSGALHMTAVVDDQIVGAAGAESPKFKRQAHTAELGMVVVEPFWGRGIGRRLMELIIDWGRSRRLRKLSLKVFDHNARAIRLYESSGFTEEGRLRGEVLRADGQYADMIIMSRRYEQ